MTTFRSIVGKQQHRWSGTAMLAGGLLWLGLLTLGMLHDFWSSPLGPITYERYNRLATLPLLLVVAGWLDLRRAQLRPRGMLAPITWGLVLIGLLLLALGNIAEFWVALLQSHYVPFRLGGTLGPIARLGWPLFMLGCVALPTAMVAYGVVALRMKLLPRWNVAPLLVGLLELTSLALVFFGSRAGMSFDRTSAIHLATLGIGWLILGSTCFDWRSTYAGWRALPRHTAARTPRI